jgi:DNA topoisomerase-6 subunit A
MTKSKRKPRAKPKSLFDETAATEIYTIAKNIYSQIDDGDIPNMVIPLRTKTNIKFDPRKAVWKYGKYKGMRSAKKLLGAYMLLRTMYTLDFIQEMIGQSKSSTLREMYYISEGWEMAKFNAQDESNKLVEDLEIITKCMREDFKLRPEENGASIMGNVTIEEKNRKGQRKRINCKDDVGDAGYNIPYNVEKEKIKILDADAKFIMAIETGGMFDRLIENGFDEDMDAILVHLKGQPARSTRRFLRRLYEEKKLPVVVFTDGDPEYLAVPTAMYCGITASDIMNYKLPSDKLNTRDVKALEAELTDPRFKDQFWKDEIELMLKINKKAEQQALAKYGLDYVTDKYLPEKLSEIGVI